MYGILAVHQGMPIPWRAFLRRTLRSYTIYWMHRTINGYREAQCYYTE